MDKCDMGSFDLFLYLVMNVGMYLENRLDNVTLNFPVLPKWNTKHISLQKNSAIDRKMTSKNILMLPLCFFTVHVYSPVVTCWLEPLTAVPSWKSFHNLNNVQNKRYTLFNRIYKLVVAITVGFFHNDTNSWEPANPGWSKFVAKTTIRKVLWHLIYRNVNKKVKKQAHVLKLKQNIQFNNNHPWCVE